MAKIIKDGLVIPFSCSICGCSFVVGINVLKSEDGNDKEGRERDA